MSTKMIGLDKIYLHHSVYPGRTTMIDCHGHHNSSGGNGSGKTTLQKLIPIFYGEQVNKVVPTQVRSTKESFTKYYLKSEASFVAFEYTNPNGKCCVILHKKNEHLRYRFIKGALTDHFYTLATKPVLKKGKPIHEYIKSLPKEAEVSQIVSTAEDYRAILQNDKALIHTRQQSLKNIQQLANTFSLGGPGSHMTLMHRLTYALQTRTSMFKGLEDMIVSTQFDFVTPEKPKHIENKALSDDLKSLHDFDKQIDTIKHCVSASHSRRLHEREAAKLAKSLAASIAIETERCSTIKNQIKRIQHDQEQTTEAFEARRDQLTQSKTQAKSDVRQIEKAINSIHEAKDDWENKHNIQFKKDQYAQIDVLQETMLAADKHYHQLIEGISEERETLDHKIRDIQMLAKEQQLILDQKKNDLLERRQAQTERAIEQKEAEKHRATNEREALIQIFNEEKEALVIERTGFKVDIQNTGNNEEERLAQAAEEENYHRLCHQEQNVEEKVKNLTDQMQSAAKTFDAIESELDSIKSTLKKQEASKAQLDQQRNPDNNTLLAWLKREKTDWAETIGKVIHPSLLEREDLAPVLVEASDSIFGLSLDLNPLPMPQHAEDDEQLALRLETIEKEITELKKSLNKTQKRLAATSAEKQRLESENQEVIASLQSARNHKAASYSKWQQIKESNQAERENRQSGSKDKLKAIQTRLDQFIETHNEQLERALDNSQSYLNELSGILSAEKSEIDDSIAHLSNEKQQVIERTVQEIKELEAAFEASMKNQGLDEAIEIDAKARWKAATKAYTAAKNSVDDINKYESWLANSYYELPGLEKDLLSAQTTLDACERDIEKLTQDYQQAKKTNLSGIKAQQQALTVLNEQLADANLLINQVGEFPETDVSLDETDLFKLTALLQAEYKDFQAHTQNTLEMVRQSLLLIEKRQDSRIYEQWLNIYNSKVGSSQHDPLSQAFQLNLPPLFEELLYDHLPHIRQSTIETVIAVAGQIDNYYQELSRIHHEIENVSNKLSKRINTNQQIKALSDIGIRLVSKVEECGAWEEMRAFNKLWSSIAMTNDRSLPPLTLTEALNDVIDALEYAHKAPDIHSLISLVVTLKENGNYKEITSDSAMNDASSNGLSLLAVIAIYIGMSRYLCPDENISLTWPVDELSTIDLDNIASLFAMLNAVNIRLFSAFPTKEHNILKHFDSCHELDYKRGALSMIKDAPEVSLLAEQLKQQMEATA